MKEINQNSTSNTEKYSEKTNPNINNYVNNIRKGKSNTKIMVFILIPIIIFIAIAIGISIYILKYKNRETKLERMENLNELSNISASYYVSKNEEFLVFNPDKINLTKSEYSIKLENQTKLRLLTNIELKDGKMLSSFEGIITLSIGIIKELNSLNGLFSGCTKLKDIDLSDLNTFKVTNYDSIFEGCSSLETINFPKNKSQNIYSMNNMFGGCQNIKEVNLSSFNISKTTSMANIFSGCYNLQNIDISSFNNIKIDFFNGINSGVNILTNKDLANEIRNNLKTVNIEINIILNELIQQNLCKIGEESKCKKCGGLFKFLCTECYEGFYLYTDYLLKTTCRSCEIENCNKCFNLFNNIICSSCKEGYKLVNNKCIPKDKEIVKECEKGENEKCLSCNNEKGKEDQCLKCNQGYYLPSNQNNKTVCKKCEIDKCIDCHGILNSNDIICNNFLMTLYAIIVKKAIN